jgi:hypothetical protein
VGGFLILPVLPGVFSCFYGVSSTHSLKLLFLSSDILAHPLVQSSSIMITHTIVAVIAASLAVSVVARTDLSGCVSSETVRYGGASLIWYVPGTGEICEFLDCGKVLAKTEYTPYVNSKLTDVNRRRWSSSAKDYGPWVCCVFGNGYLHTILSSWIRRRFRSNIYFCRRSRFYSGSGYCNLKCY